MRLNCIRARVLSWSAVQGNMAQLMGKEGAFALVRLPSGEMRKGADRVPCFYQSGF